MLRDPFSKKIQSLLIHNFRRLITLHSYKWSLRQLSTELELPETSKGRKLFKTSGIHIWGWAQHGSATWHGGGGSCQATQLSPVVHRCFVRGHPFRPTYFVSSDTAQQCWPQKISTGGFPFHMILIFSASVWSDTPLFHENDEKHTKAYKMEIK